MVSSVVTSSSMMMVCTANAWLVRPDSARGKSDEWRRQLLPASCEVPATVRGLTHETTDALHRTDTDRGPEQRG